MRAPCWIGRATGGVNSNIAGGLNQQMFADEMQAIIETAHMFGRKVAAHAHGKDADIIAVSGSPLDDVKRLENVSFVMRRGVVHKLDGKRQPFPEEPT